MEMLGGSSNAGLTALRTSFATSWIIRSLRSADPSAMFACGAATKRFHRIRHCCDTVGTLERHIRFPEVDKCILEKMPVILLWGIPTLIVIGGGTYWLLHLHP
jgi:hypothetical protein